VGAIGSSRRVSGVPGWSPKSPELGLSIVDELKRVVWETELTCFPGRLLTPLPKRQSRHD
jgi:hypothetical protein